MNVNKKMAQSDKYENYRRATYEQPFNTSNDTSCKSDHFNRAVDEIEDLQTYYWSEGSTYFDCDDCTYGSAGATLRQVKECWKENSYTHDIVDVDRVGTATTYAPISTHA